MPTHIAIPDERAEQLRRFATSQNISIADAVGVLINDAVRAGKIPQALPGVTVERIGDQVTVDFGTFLKTFPRVDAKKYAAQLMGLVEPRAGTTADALTALAAMSVGIVRQGRAIKLTDIAGEKIVAHSVAADIARLIDKAAAELPSA